MDVDQVDLINAALVEIGNTAFIENIDEQSQEAMVAKVVYEHCVERCLEEGEWFFACKRASLNQLVATAPTNWLYAYTLPGDFIKILNVVVEGSIMPPSVVRSEYVLENFNGDRVLLSNLEAVEILYVASVTDVSIWTPKFRDALILLLASKFAGGIKKDRKLAKDLEIDFLAAVSEASAISRNQRETQKLEPVTPSERARGGSSVFGTTE